MRRSRKINAGRERGNEPKRGNGAAGRKKGNETKRENRTRDETEERETRRIRRDGGKTADKKIWKKRLFQKIHINYTELYFL